MITQPRWLRDLKRFLPLRSQFVLSGNIRDQFPISVDGAPPMLLPIVDYLGAELSRSGIQRVVAYNPVTGFYLPNAIERNNESDAAFFKECGIDVTTNGGTPVSLERFFEQLRPLITSQVDEPVALISDFASRLIRDPEHLGQIEQNGFAQALVLAHEARSRPHPQDRRPTFNPIIWLVDKEGDLPDWFTIDNPRIRQIPIPKPDHTVRKDIVGALTTIAPEAAELTTDERTKVELQFIESTHGLRLVDLYGITQLMRAENVPARQILDAVRRYKLGVTEDPWRQIDRNKLRNAEAFVRKRVKGQDKAVRHMLDIVTRAATGIGGRRGGRPRGVAFLAGPTGVGKTELAKTITELIFGDETAYIRFDMSEFSAEHADQRLIGAPPGYVGYDTGGELTNAIREKPFSVVLFDEIEKAHPRILDKFLQVLDDGVLTSGRGERVYFSESLIIFTSNLGMSAVGGSGGPSTSSGSIPPYDEMAPKVRGAIEDHFKHEIGRPELLNRIGENVIIFDYIRPDLAEQIFATLMHRTLGEIGQSLTIQIQIDPHAMSALQSHCLRDLSNGGRGIRNAIEVAFVNPLSRLIFDMGIEKGDSVTITEAALQSSGMRLEARK